MNQPNSTWHLNAVDESLIKLALQEDLGQPFCDATTDTLFASQKIPYSMRIVSKEKHPIVFCGLLLVDYIFKLIDPQCSIRSDFYDGNIIKPGDTLVSISGNASSLLQGERTVLNFLQRLCAVSTLTAKFVRRAQGTQLKILDTRKTTPGFRHLEKYAVQCGGGVNHRLGLYDALMIKDNHIDMMGGMEKTLQVLPLKQDKQVIMEVRSLEEFHCALAHGEGKVDRLLLDNMTLEMMRSCVKDNASKFELEASGNLHLNTISDLAQTGVNFASIGALTHSAGSVDLSMQVTL